MRFMMQARCELHLVNSHQNRTLTRQIDGNFFAAPLPNIPRERLEARMSREDGIVREEKRPCRTLRRCRPCRRIREILTA